MRVAALAALGVLASAACQSDPAIEADELKEIVLRPEEGLPGVEYDPDQSGPADRFLEREFGPAWPPDGYQSSYQRYFQGPAPEDPATFPVEDLRGLVSMAMVFESPEAASDHLDAIFPARFRLDVAGFDSLGEERRGLVTQATGTSLSDPAARPRRTTLIWRRGNAFLQLSVLGEFPLEDVIPLARAVDERAAALLAA